MYRQGDVLLIPFDNPLQGAVAIEGRILASGDATGHAHVATHGRLLRLGREMFLQASRPTRIVHDEHGAIELPAGVYRVVRQRELGGTGPLPVSD